MDEKCKCHFDDAEGDTLDALEVTPHLADEMRQCHLGSIQREVQLGCTAHHALRVGLWRLQGLNQKTPSHWPLHQEACLHDKDNICFRGAVFVNFCLFCSPRDATRYPKGAQNTMYKHALFKTLQGT